MKSVDINSKQQSMLAGFSVLGLAGIINKVLSVLYVPLLTLFLGNEGNGIYNAGYQIYAFIFVITNNGIPIAVSKLISAQTALGRYADARRTFRLATLFIVSLGSFAAVLMAAFARPLANLINRPEAYLTILALSPTLLFTSLASSIRGYFQGRSVMSYTGVSQVVEQLVNSVLTVGFAWLFLQWGQQSALAAGLDGGAVYLRGITWAAAGGTVGTSLGAVASAFYLSSIYYRHRAPFLLEARQNGGIAPAGSRELLRELLVLALPIIIGSTLVNAANLVDLSFTNGRLLAAGFTPLQASALYGVLSTQFQKVITIPLALMTALSAAVIPNVSAAFAKGEGVLLGKRIHLAYKSALLVTLPAAAGLCALAQPVITLLFPHAPQGADLMVLGSWTIILIGLVSVQTAILQGMGHARIPPLVLCGALAIKILINYTLVGQRTLTLFGVTFGMNIRGAVIGSLVCYGLAALVNALCIRRISGVKAAGGLFFKPALASLLVAAASFLVHTAVAEYAAQFFNGYVCNLLGILAAVPLAGYWYLRLLFRFAILSRQDISQVIRQPRLQKFLKFF